MELAAYFHAGSCKKCRPCADGTARTLTMLERLDVLDSKSVDLPGRTMPMPKRRYALRILGQADPAAPTGVSYTDMTTGLAKIEEFCEFYKYRGDCHHSTEAASVIQRLIALFRPEFEARLAPAPVAAEEALEPVGAD
jgi:NADH:ubiquinone oxidoreductase subunit F (NADH-binding)